MSWIDLTNFGIASGGLLVAILCFIFTCTAYYMEKRSRNFFKVFFLIVILYVASDVAEQISFYREDAGSAVFSRIFLFLESVFSALLLPMLTAYLLGCAGEIPNKTKIMHCANFILDTYLGLLIYTQFSGKMYYIADNNTYSRGSLYPLLLVPPALMMLLNLIALIRRRDRLSRKQQKAFFYYFTIPLVCMLVQMCFYGLLLTVIGSSVSALLMFVFILTDQVEQNILQREENLAAKANIQILQMRPHFIYNTMTSIYYLCEQDPQKAMQTIDDFTKYLRNNFTAITKKEPIPFKEELSHVHAYLSIEQTRFTDKLYVEYDTDYTTFRIPPLTLQPIVENSVKYGVDPELDPLHISVVTKEVPGGSEIIVSDTGPGFQEEDNREPHVALSNIRERLAMMCNGTLTIRLREEGGTEVRIFIPKNL